MNKDSKDNGQPANRSKLDPIQRLRWNNTYQLLRKHTDATEEEASDLADRKLAVVKEIERVPAHA
jgi:hypothetical protein